MFDLSTPQLIWLPIVIAVSISFVKSSIQAAIAFVVLILLLTLELGSYYLWILLPGCLTLLLSSLLIPKPNPRHQKRRFQTTKFIYLILAIYSAMVLNPHLRSPGAMKHSELASSADLFQLIGFASFFILATLLLLTRKNAS